MSTNSHQFTNYASLISQNNLVCDYCETQVLSLENTEEQSCPNCGYLLPNHPITDDQQYEPSHYLPFSIEKTEAKAMFKEWVNRRWFLPNDFKDSIIDYKHFRGHYIPSWLFDLYVYTSYRGERGEDYTEYESYTEWEDGKRVRKTRSVTKTRWYCARGSFKEQFYNERITAVYNLPSKLIEKLEPWDLSQLRPFSPTLVNEHSIEKYQIDLQEARQEAMDYTESKIKRLVRHDIGGDDQRIHHIDNDFERIDCKLILLPVYVSTYSFNGETYRFLINANTGEIQGERPYSVIKIAIASVIGILLLSLIFLLSQGNY